MLLQKRCPLISVIIKCLNQGKILNYFFYKNAIFKQDLKWHETLQNKLELTRL